MQTRAHILQRPQDVLPLLSTWGLDPQDAEIAGTSHYDQGFLHIKMKSDDRAYQLRYTLDTVKNRELLESQIKIVMKWKENGVGVEEYMPTSDGSFFLSEGKHVFVLIRNCPFPKITECADMPLNRLGEALGRLHQVSLADWKSVPASTDAVQGSAGASGVAGAPGASGASEASGASGASGASEASEASDTPGATSKPPRRTPNAAIKACFAGIAENLEKGGGDSRAEAETEFLRHLITAAPPLPDSMGPILGLPVLSDIHYDEAEQKIYFTHFEHVHPFFFVQDLACLTRAIARHYGDRPHTAELNAFLNGYRASMPFPEEEESLLELFTRIAALEEFSNLLFSTSEVGQGESSDQLMERCALFSTMSELGEGFGSPVMGFSPKSTDTPDFELLKSVLPVYYTKDLLATTTWYEDVLRFQIFHDQDVQGRKIAIACRDTIRMIFVEVSGRKVFPVRELYGDGLDGYLRTNEPEILQAEMMAEGVSIIKELSKTDFSERAFIFEDIDHRRFEVRYEKA